MGDIFQDHAPLRHNAADIVGAVTIANVKADPDIASAISLKHSNAADLTLSAVKADADIASAISLKHSNAADLTLSAVKADTDIASAISLKHSNAADLTLSAVKADTDIASAISLKHSRNSDTDLIIDTLGTDLTGIGHKVSKMSGEIFAFGDVGYLKSDGKVWKAKGDAVGTTKGLALFALQPMTADFNGQWLTIGKARNDGWNWTPGAELYMSDATAGLITDVRPTTVGNFVRIVGYALDADNIIFQPDGTYIEIGA
jgi:hypothetical protein